MTKSALRALRVGVLIRESLVEEKVFAAAAPITLGQSTRCTLSVPVEGVPREHVLFAIHDAGFVLCLTAAMEGRLAIGERVITLDELRACETAQDGVWSVSLARGVRGRVHVGEATLLFQELAAAPALPRLQLPASIRGTLADRVDRRLAAIVGASLLAHVGIAAWAWETERGSDPRPLAFATEPTPTSIDAIDVALPDPPTRAQPAPPAPGAAIPPSPHQVAPRVPARPRVDTPRVPDLSASDGARIATMLTDDDTGETGHRDLSRRAPGESLHQQIEEARERGAKIGGNDHTSRVDDRNHVDTEHHPNVPLGDPNRITHVERTDKEPPGRVDLGKAKTDDDTSLTPTAVERTIHDSYMPGLERCYHRAQVLEPSLSGKVTLTFTVDSHGRVTDAEASGVTPQVDSCVQSQMGHWHFTAPRTKKGDPTDASYRISLALQPS
jgi:outer membrane biosynthesis protein TonB